MNFQTIIQDMLARGETEVSIAAEVGQTRQNINHLLLGKVKSPSWYTGDKLISMHRKTMKKYPKIDAAA